MISDDIVVHCVQPDEAERCEKCDWYRRGYIIGRCARDRQRKSKNSTCVGWIPKQEGSA